MAMQRQVSSGPAVLAWPAGLALKCHGAPLLSEHDTTMRSAADFFTSPSPTPHPSLIPSLVALAHVLRVPFERDPAIRLGLRASEPSHFKVCRHTVPSSLLSSSHSFISTDCSTASEVAVARCFDF